MFRKKLLGLLLALVLVTGVPQLYMMPVHAASSGGDYILAFTSDVHNEPGNESANRLSAWIQSINNYVGGSIDFMTFCGDMGKSSGEPYSGELTGNFWTWAQAAMNAADQILGAANTAYTTGNHELDKMDGGYIPGTLYGSDSTQSKFVTDTLVSNTDKYEIYCLGSLSDSQSSGGYSTEQVSKLSNYLNGISLNSKKVYYIATHFPLHSYNSNWTSRSTKNAANVISTINNAVNAKNINVVFIWGHNHTLSDTNYGKVIKPGSVLSGSNTPIQFYYLSAGCMSDSENTSGSGASIAAKGMMSRITNDGKYFYLSFFDKDGNIIGSETKIEADRTKYTVSFNANGHGTTPPSQSVLRGGKASNPGNLSAEGWNFTGWYTDSSCTAKYDFSTPVTADKELFAGWSKVRCAITFDLNGESAAAPKPANQTVDYGAKAVQPTAPSVSGKSFGGWYTNSSCTISYDFNAAVKKNMTLYAKWTAVNPDPGSGGDSGGSGGSGGGNTGSGGSGSGGAAGGGASGSGEDTPVDDQAAVDSVAAIINSLPAAITINDKSAVENARASFIALKAEQKALVSTQILDKLNAAESALRSAEAVKAVEDSVDALPDSSAIKISDKSNVEAAKAAYDVLTESEKASLDPNKVERLQKAIAAISKLELAKASNINKAKVTASDIRKASELGAVTVTLGKTVKKISAKAFSGKGIKTVIVKSKKLTSKSVRNAFKGSEVKTIKIKIGTTKTNKTYIKKYKKIFTKKNAGKRLQLSRSHIRSRLTGKNRV